MKNKNRLARWGAVAVLTGALMLTEGAVSAQDYAAPPLLAPQQLDGLVGRIALYPDPLLAQVLAAATFSNQIPDAARWASDHRYLRGDELAAAIDQSQLPWDPSIQALIPFPDVLDTMARDMNWTYSLGNAVLAQRPDVMDAVQRMRIQAERYGYLRSNEQVRVVDGGGWTEIVPYNPAVIYVPVYDPYVVYAPPRPGFFVGGAIRFGGGFTIGVFGRWGWGGGFDWRHHDVIVNHAVWERNWVNRGQYVHNWNNWDGGRWRNAPPNRTVVINNNVNVRRDVVVERDVHRDVRDVRAPAVRPGEGNRDRNVQSFREGFRANAPAAAPAQSRNFERQHPANRPAEHRAAPERHDDHSRSENRGHENRFR